MNRNVTLGKKGDFGYVGVVSGLKTPSTEIMRLDDCENRKGPVQRAYRALSRDVRKLRRRLSDRWAYLYTFVSSQLFKKPSVYVIGDSHVGVFEGQKNFLVHKVGSATAYNLNKSDSTTQSGIRLFEALRKVRPGDIVLFSFGEIDCRIHIYYQFKKLGERIPISTLIKKTVANYRDVLQVVADRGVNFCVYGIPPAGKQENNYEYPFYGDAATRAQIYQEFNDELRKMCEASGFRFIDVLSKVKDQDGLISVEFASPDGVYLSSKVVQSRVKSRTRS